MSRVGNSVIQVPSGVNISIQDKLFSAKGKLGELSLSIPSYLELKHEGQELRVALLTKSKESRMMWGTTQRNLANIVKGVSEGFTLDMEIVGVGYRAAVQGSELVLQLGFSHEVRYKIPAGISVKCEKPTSIQLQGADKQKIGQMAAEVRSYRPPEPYKGKGVIRAGEYVLRKVGKKK
ncbi:MAG: 50S ribosomal protein L6 [Alphaproteobacteria bacterium]|nr:50S ribosomal protein L6 [Alphaproteobacteria bacterium]OJV45057.1 MAG: 50S ribosomal protein L6 [Alphaproteobacteria bacterium 43-37]